MSCSEIFMPGHKMIKETTRGPGVGDIGVKLSYFPPVDLDLDLNLDLDAPVVGTFSRAS